MGVLLFNFIFQFMIMFILPITNKFPHYLMCFNWLPNNSKTELNYSKHPVFLMFASNVMLKFDNFILKLKSDISYLLNHLFKLYSRVICV